MARFDPQTISDQKRLVRGEHLLLARSILRVRDEVHSRPWKVMMLAGGAPAGEVTAIRELMPKAVVLAVDNDPTCIDAAIEAGVDDVVLCDLECFETTKSYSGTLVIGPAREVAPFGRFDIVSLDLCAGPNQRTKDLAKVYYDTVESGGVFILTFSYGRDVTEMFLDALRKVRERAQRREQKDPANPGGARVAIERLEGAGVPETLLARLFYLLPANVLARTRSVMAYRGHEMPMCSIVVGKAATSTKASFVSVGAGDFELAVVYPNAVNMYDCPQERIEALRRKFAAIKASMTKAGREVAA